jgi:hypothetical protein
MTTMPSILLLLLHAATCTALATTYNYFAFGSNLVPETMTALRNLDPISSTAAVLPDYKLRFNIAGLPLVEPSAAAVEKCNGEVVHGVVYTLTEDDFARVGSTEGVPFAYRWQSCDVYPYIGDGDKAGYEAVLAANDKEPMVAYTLVSGSSSTSRDTDIPPSKSYRDILIDGARFWKMDADYVQSLESTPYARNLLIPDGLSGATLRIAEFRQKYFGTISKGR